MSTPSNALNINDAGLVRFDGTATFDGVTTTNHAILIGATSNGITNVGPDAATGKVLQSQGASADPAFSTATYPSTATGTGTILRADGTNWVATTATYPATTTVSEILYSSSANVVSGLATANRAVLTTTSGGVPQLTALTDGQLIIGSTAGAPAAASLTAGSGITITPGSNSITIAAAGSSGGLGQVVIFDDFMGVVGTSAGFGNNNLKASSSGSGTPSQTNGTAQNPGISVLSISSNGQYISVYGGQTGAAAGDFVLGNGEISFTSIINIPTLPDGTQRFVTYTGLANNLEASLATINDGCWFSYVDNVNSGKWLINCKNNAGTTSLDSGVAGGTGFNTFKVVVNAAASSVSFYINGTQTSNSPIAANIPTDPISFFAGCEKTLGNTARTIQLDMFLFNYTMTTPRAG